MNTYQLRRLAALLLSCIFLVSGCASSGGQAPPSAPRARDAVPSYAPGQTQVLVPAADGKETTGGGPLELDFSHSDEGYFMGRLTGAAKKINLQVTGPDEIIYKYFLEIPEEWTAFPLTAGSGPYLILAFEDIGGGQYATLFSYPLNVRLKSEFLPFLYPNQYVEFTADSEAVAAAEVLSKEAASDLDALNAIYRYVTEHITYDDNKAATVELGYLPDVDETLRTKTGICFDYASLTCAMLRVLSIPARLEIGYSGDIRHAWIDVYIQSIGWVERAVEFNGDEWKLMDPTFASAGKDNEAILDYIGDGSNYTLQYVR